MRLGMWMDWDARLLHVLRHEHRVHLALPRRPCTSAAGSIRAIARPCGARAAGPRSRSTSSFVGRVPELEHPSVFVRFPLRGREGESLVVWTTTPWTLPGERRGGGQAGGRVRAARGRRVVARVEREPDDDVRAVGARRGARRARVRGAVRPPARAGGRRPPRDPVGRRRRSTEGTRHRPHRAGCGRGGLRARPHPRPPRARAARRGGPHATRLRLRRALHRRGRRASRSTTSTRAASCSRRARSSTATRPAGAAARRSSSASSTTGSSRPTRSGSRCSTRTRPSSGRPTSTRKRMDDWLRNMGDWNISRKRYFGLPLPFYPCACGHLNVIGSRAELEERAVGGLDQLQELHRPWIDEVPIRCEACGEEVRRIPEVGDAGSTPGIVPLSTLGWENAEQDPRRATRPARRRGSRSRTSPTTRTGRSGSPPTGSRRCASRSGSGSTRISFMSVTLVGRCAVPARARLREAPRRDGPRDAPLVGKRDRGRRGVRAHGRGRHALAVHVRSRRPQPPLRLRPRARDPAAAADALELGEVPRRLREHRGLAAPRGTNLERGPAGELQPLDRWLVARTNALVRGGDRRRTRAG